MTGESSWTPPDVLGSSDDKDKEEQKDDSESASLTRRLSTVSLHGKQTSNMDFDLSDDDDEDEEVEAYEEDETPWTLREEREKTVFGMFLNATLEGMEELKAKTLPIDTASMDLFASLEDGVLLCGLLVALLGEDTVDPRAVNWEATSDARIMENLNLAINGAKAAGCDVNDLDPTSFDSSRSRNRGKMLNLLYEIIKATLTSTVNLRDTPEVQQLKTRDEEISEFSQVGLCDLLSRWVVCHAKDGGLGADHCHKVCSGEEGEGEAGITATGAAGYDSAARATFTAVGQLFPESMRGDWQQLAMGVAGEQEDGSDLYTTWASAVHAALQGAQPLAMEPSWLTLFDPLSGALAPEGATDEVSDEDSGGGDGDDSVHNRLSVLGLSALFRLRHGLKSQEMSDREKAELLALMEEMGDGAGEEATFVNWINSLNIEGVPRVDNLSQGLSDGVVRRRIVNRLFRVINRLLTGLDDPYVEESCVSIILHLALYILFAVYFTYMHPLYMYIHQIYSIYTSY